MFTIKKTKYTHILQYYGGKDNLFPVKKPVF